MKRGLNYCLSKFKPMKARPSFMIKRTPNKTKNIFSLILKNFVKALTKTDILLYGGISGDHRMDPNMKKLHYDYKKRLFSW